MPSQVASPFDAVNSKPDFILAGAIIENNAAGKRKDGDDLEGEEKPSKYPRKCSGGSVGSSSSGVSDDQFDAITVAEVVEIENECQEEVTEDQPVEEEGAYELKYIFSV